MEKVIELLPLVAMVAIECLDVGLTTISKAAMSKGMSHFVFVVYSNALATLLLFPVSFFFQRFRTRRTPITFSLLLKFFLLALVGITAMQNCVFTGISYSSPTLGSAISQLIPAFTFILAVVFRMEKVNMKSLGSRVKIIGTVVSITGALIVIFFKGPPIGPPNSDSPASITHQDQPTNSSWIIGGGFLVAACLSVSISTISQAAILKECPSELTIISFYSLFGTIQSAIVSLIAERNSNAWKIRADVELIPIIYSAVIGTAMTSTIVAWCIRKKGPIFVASFKPLSIAIAAFLGVIFLGDRLYIGSIIGAAIIVVGFYGVTWAQFQEEGVGELSKPPSFASLENASLLESQLDE